jgi:hypothetical protein
MECARALESTVPTVGHHLLWRRALVTEGGLGVVVWIIPAAVP